MRLRSSLTNSGSSLMVWVMRDPIALAVLASGRRHRDLATAIGLGRCAFADRMRGRTRWRITEARALAIELDMSLDDLLVGPETPEGGAA